MLLANEPQEADSYGDFGSGSDCGCRRLQFQPDVRRKAGLRASAIAAFRCLQFLPKGVITLVDTPLGAL